MTLTEFVEKWVPDHRLVDSKTCTAGQIADAAMEDRFFADGRVRLVALPLDEPSEGPKIYLTSTQAAKMMGCAIRTACLLFDRGDVGGHRIGRDRRFDSDSVREFVQKRNGVQIPVNGGRR